MELPFTITDTIDISEDQVEPKYVDLPLDTDIREVITEANEEGIEIDRMTVLLIQLIRDVRRLAVPRTE